MKPRSEGSLLGPSKVTPRPAMPAPDATGNGAEFPTDWQVVRLDAVALSGGTPPSSRRSGAGFRCRA